MKKLYNTKRIETKELNDLHIKHLFAMTSEELHSKSEIAAELAIRDLEIQNLEHDLKSYMDISNKHLNDYETIKKENLMLKNMFNGLDTYITDLIVKNDKLLSEVDILKYQIKDIMDEPELYLPINEAIL